MPRSIQLRSDRSVTRFDTISKHEITVKRSLVAALAYSADQITEPSDATQAQWVNADVRSFDLSVLGQFAVILCDPPWNVRLL